MIIKEIDQVTLEHLGRRNNWLETAAMAEMPSRKVQTAVTSNGSHITVSGGIRSAPASRAGGAKASHEPQTGSSDSASIRRHDIKDISEVVPR